MMKFILFLSIVTGHIICSEGTPCGAVIEPSINPDFEGEVTSPNFGSTYTPGEECNVTVLVPYFDRIKIQIVTMELREDDTVLIDDAACTSGNTWPKVHRLRDYRGIVPMPLSDLAFSTGEGICIRLLRYSKMHTPNIRGYKILFTAIPNCEGFYTAPSSHVLSPGFPVFSAGKNIRCSWTIHSEAGQRLEITTQEIALTGNCEDSALNIIGLEVFNATYCGKTTVAESMLSQTTNVTITFTTDADTKFKGFWLSYRAHGCRTRELPSIPNGKMINPSEYYGTFYQAVYECDTGYHLSSNQTKAVITCDKAGKWSGSVQCVANTCGKPRVPFNGHNVTYDKGLDYESKATLICNDGSTPDGNVISCQADGTWSAAFPDCTGDATDCNDPGTPSHGNRHGDDFAFNSVVQYYCDPGYELVGNENSTCQSTGKWDNDLPKCKVIICPDTPQAGGNSNVTIDGSTYGSVAIYTCREDLEIFGDVVRMCSADKTWSGQIPRCLGLSCFQPRKRPHLNMRYSEYLNVGSSASYAASEGFLMHGPTSRICLSNGNWAGESPMATGKSCGHPPEHPHSSALYYGFFIGDVAHYECIKGYRPTGNNHVQCMTNGKWSKTNFVCKKTGWTAGAIAGLTVLCVFGFAILVLIVVGLIKKRRDGIAVPSLPSSVRGKMGAVRNMFQSKKNDDMRIPLESPNINIQGAQDLTESVNQGYNPADVTVSGLPQQTVDHSGASKLDIKKFIKDNKT